MSITIHPAELQDASGMLDVSMAAFAGDVLSEATFGLSSASEEEVADFRNWRTDLTKLRMNGRGKHYFKAVDSSTGSVVGFIGVYGPDAEAPAQSSVSLPTHMNHEVDDEVKTKMKAANDRLVGDRKDVWYVQSMAVHPDHQGRGIARRLVERAVKGADEAEQDVYLEATPAGQTLYRRCGFVEVDDISLMGGKYSFKVMIRHPKGLQQ